MSVIVRYCDPRLKSSSRSQDSSSRNQSSWEHISVVVLICTKIGVGAIKRKCQACDYDPSMRVPRVFMYVCWQRFRFVPNIVAIGINGVMEEVSRVLFVFGERSTMGLQKLARKYQTYERVSQIWGYTWKVHVELQYIHIRVWSEVHVLVSFRDRINWKRMARRESWCQLASAEMGL